MSIIVPQVVANRILLLRGQRVMLDADLAELYGVTTKRLNEQVSRNADRFPEDFMFRLDAKEKSEVVANCDHVAKLRQLMVPPVPTRRGIGFTADMDSKPRNKK